MHLEHPHRSGMHLANFLQQSTSVCQLLRASFTTTLTSSTKGRVIPRAGKRADFPKLKFRLFDELDTLKKELIVLQTDLHVLEEKRSNERAFIMAWNDFTFLKLVPFFERYSKINETLNDVRRKNCDPQIDQAFAQFFSADKKRPAFLQTHGLTDLISLCCQIDEKIQKICRDISHDMQGKGGELKPLLDSANDAIDKALALHRGKATQHEFLYHADTQATALFFTGLPRSERVKAILPDEFAQEIDQILLEQSRLIRALDVANQAYLQSHDLAAKSLMAKEVVRVREQNRAALDALVERLARLDGKRRLTDLQHFIQSELARSEALKTQINQLIHDHALKPIDWKRPLAEIRGSVNKELDINVFKNGQPAIDEFNRLFNLLTQELSNVDEYVILGAHLDNAVATLRAADQVKLSSALIARRIGADEVEI